jgi:membrane fusion protein, multidrug efflux system
MKANIKIRRKSFWTKTLLITGLFFSSVAITGCKEKEPPKKEQTVKQIKLLTVSSTRFDLSKEFPGRTNATTTVDLSFRVSGPLIEFPTLKGQFAKEGDVLARIDPRDFETQVKNNLALLDEAQANLQSMKTGARPEDLIRLGENVNARLAEFEELEAREKRYKELLDTKVISQDEYDTIKANYNVSKSELENARQQLVIGKTGARKEDILAQEGKVNGLAAELENSRNALKDTTLLAPFSGVISTTYVDNFQDVQAKEVILRLQDIRNIDVIVNISENDMARGATIGATIKDLQENVNAIASFSAIKDRTFETKIREFETEADANTQTFAVTFQIVQPKDLPIRPGMNAVIKGDRKNKATAKQSGILIPFSSVVAGDEGKKSVWLVGSDKKVTTHPITANEIIGDDILVTEGLKDGDIIAISAVNTLRLGDEVQQMGNLADL